MKFNYLLAFAFIFSISCATIGSASIFPKENIETYKTLPVYLNIEISKDYYSEQLLLNEIQELSYLNALSHEYKLHVYDCTQFSEKLVKELIELGYKAQCTAGNNWNFDYTNHTWVSVWLDDVRYEIEATSGKILNKDDYSTYEVKWENKCW